MDFTNAFRTADQSVTDDIPILAIRQASQNVYKLTRAFVSKNAILVGSGVFMVGQEASVPHQAHRTSGSVEEHRLGPQRLGLAKIF